MSTSSPSMNTIKLELQLETERHENARLNERIAFLEQELREAHDRSAKQFKLTESSLMRRIESLQESYLKLHEAHLTVMEENTQLKHQLEQNLQVASQSNQRNSSNSQSIFADTSLAESLDSTKTSANTTSVVTSPPGVGSGEARFIRAVVSAMSEPTLFLGDVVVERGGRGDNISTRVMPNGGSSLPKIEIDTPLAHQALSEGFDDQLVATGRQLLLELTGLDRSEGSRCHSPDAASSSSSSLSSSRSSEASTSSESQISRSSDHTSTTTSVNPEDFDVNTPLKFPAETTTELEEQFDVAKAVLSSSTLEGLSRRLHELNPTLFPLYDGSRRVMQPDGIASAASQATESSATATSEETESDPNTFLGMIHKAARSLMSATAALTNPTTPSRWLESADVDAIARANLPSIARAQQLTAELEEHKRQVAARVAQIQLEHDPEYVRQRELERRRELVARYLYRLYREAAEAESQAAAAAATTALCPVAQLRALKDKFL